MEVKIISQEKSFWDQFKYPPNVRDALVFVGGVITGRYGIDLVLKKLNEYSEKRDLRIANRVTDELKGMLKDLYKESGAQE